MGFLNFEDTGSTVWTVAELTAYIKELFEIDFRLRDLDVSGEISNFTRARSGHLYFTIKDDEAQLKCVMWRTSAQRLHFDPQDGDAVVIHGRISVYEASGVYQLYADYMEPAGRGDLALAFERLKEKLAGEGLFDNVHKKPLPAYPKKIGLVTSADAAALRDILNVLQRRHPLLSVLLAPTLVQGLEAPPQIIQAIRWLDGRDDIELIIVARGGGSIEDLWAFNDEGVARAIFAARHPIISGVGHETDFTIADFVADLRAPTPSAAAELAVPDLSDLSLGLASTRDRLVKLLRGQLEQAGWQLQGLQRSLQYLSPLAQLDSYFQRVDSMQMRLERAINHTLERAGSMLALADSHLQAVNPAATLARGYAIVRHRDGRIVTSVSQVRKGDDLEIQVSDGSFGATAE
ncbi:MAG: exodeoxyribonuclease VII large subunit [Candidatus Promineifilaceae bacterium]